MLFLSGRFSRLHHPGPVQVPTRGKNCKAGKNICVFFSKNVYHSNLFLSQCNLDMLKTDGSVPTMNLFKQVLKPGHVSQTTCFSSQVGTLSCFLYNQLSFGFVICQILSRTNRILFAPISELNFLS